MMQHHEVIGKIMQQLEESKIALTDFLMDNQGSEPYKSAEMAQLICTQYGIRLPADFVKIPEYKQMNLFDEE